MKCIATQKREKVFVGTIWFRDTMAGYSRFPTSASSSSFALLDLGYLPIPVEEKRAPDRL